MSPPIIVALIGVGGVVVTGLISYVTARLSIRHERKADADAIVARYTGPLLHAAFDLQSRLWNILCDDFFESYYRSNQASQRQKDYAISNTLFLIGQYFCWIEIIRREVQFLDIGRRTKKVSELRNTIDHQWHTDEGFGRDLMIWSGEQRAIGEELIVDRGDRPDAAGYVEFRRLFQQKRLPVLPDIEPQIRAVADGDEGSRDRLMAIQRSLIDMIRSLDKDRRYFPEDNLTYACP